MLKLNDHDAIHDFDYEDITVHGKEIKRVSGTFDSVANFIEITHFESDDTDENDEDLEIYLIDRIADDLYDLGHDPSDDRYSL